MFEVMVFILGYSWKIFCRRCTICARLRTNIRVYIINVGFERILLLLWMEKGLGGRRCVSREHYV